jgi:thiamine-phosphate pyrophosphorylase
MSCRLYYITDRAQFDGDERTRRRALLAKIADAAAAGVDYIQLREKDLSARELEILAKEALSSLRGSAPPRTENRELRTPGSATRLLINSRADVALAVGADGVHLRSEDIAPHELREALDMSAHRPLISNHFVVAASCHSVSDVFHAESEKADFAVFAPVFGKRAAAGTPPAGLAALREACKAKIPVFALGGVTMENAASCLEAGAAGVAGIRLFQKNKIEDVVRELRAL